MDKRVIMSHKMLIDGNHPEETRVVVVSGNKVEDFDFESAKKRQVSGNIYLAKVTRVEPSLQAAFLDYGGNRHGFLAFSEIHPDYYQIPKEDKAKLIEESKLEAKQQQDEIDLAEENIDKGQTKPKSRVRKRNKQIKKSANEDIKEIAEDIISEEINEKKIAEDKASNAKSKEELNHENSEPEITELINEETEIEIRRAAAKRGKSLIRKYNIQEVIKVRQIMLVQVVKEERGNKGAALTSYLSLAGRYCVLMPNTTRGGGISRKITNPNDRKRLKEITNSITVPESAGLIIRTAGINRTKVEIKKDYEYLIRQWENLRDLTLKSIAPTLIYEEGSLIKRSIRDLYNKPTEEIIVQGEASYLEAKEYMKMLMPSHAKNVKKYDFNIPLFSRYQVETHLTAMFNPNVQLKSGGYIVIGTTEALVAIDVNSGRSTKETSIEETAVKTNLEAAEEISRQLKLRDLAGLIVIDFIDMEDRKNNALVEKTLYDKVKNDRARIQLGKISSFGLLEMSRQRLRSGMVEATTHPCPHCFGTGTTRSDESLGLAILRDLQQEVNAKAIETIIIDCSIEVANFLLNKKRVEISNLETELNISIQVLGDKSLVNPTYKISKEKTNSATDNGEKESSSKLRKGGMEKETRDKDSNIFSNDEPEIPKKKRRKRKKVSAQNSFPKDSASEEENKKAITDKDRASPKTAPKPPKRTNKDSDEVAAVAKETKAKVIKKEHLLIEDASDGGEREMPDDSKKLSKMQKKRLTSADDEPKVSEKKNAKTTSKTKTNSKKKVGWWSRDEGPKTI
mgnify:CR=1 FL=1